MKLYLIRHGQTASNVGSCYTGQKDVPLTPLGREQAKKIRPILEKISFDRVYSSDLSRAIDTQMLAIPGVEGIRTPLIREFDVGSIQEQSYDEVRAANPGWYAPAQDEAYSRFGGESVKDLCDRLGRFLKEQEDNPCENVAAFVHNGVMGAMMCLVLGVTFDRSVLRTDNCAIHVFDYVDGKWRLLAWNYMGSV